jgi:hypothetical protein
MQVIIVLADIAAESIGQTQIEQSKVRLEFSNSEILIMRLFKETAHCKAPCQSQVFASRCKQTSQLAFQVSAQRSGMRQSELVQCNMDTVQEFFRG